MPYLLDLVMFNSQINLIYCVYPSVVLCLVLLLASMPV